MDLLDQLRADIKARLDERKSKQDELDAIITAAETEGRSDFTTDEQAKFAEARAALVSIDETLAGLQAREADLVAIDEARKAAADAAAKLPQTPAATVRVGREELTYRAEGQHDFLRDAYAARFEGDTAAMQRLTRSNSEQRGEFGVELRDVGTSAFAGLVVPQYLVDLWVPLARAGSAVLNTIPKMQLPAKGMTVNLSRITTGSAAAAQANENDAVQETNIDDTLLTVNVRTYAGQQDVSRQAIERGDLVSDVVFADLAADYFTKVDAAIINGDGTSGTHLGILQVASISDTDYTDASPTVVEAWPKLANAIQKIPSNRYAPATICYMHPRRWGWFQAALDGSNRPLMNQNPNAQNSIAVGEAGNYGQVVGDILGVPVVTDANIPTTLGGGTEDAIIFARNLDFVHFHEGDGAPRYLKFEETNGGNLSVKLVVYGYSAFTAGRQPKSISTVTDTGLVTPTF